MFTGPGGNVVVWHGEEDKVVVDTFVQGAFPGLKQRLDAMGADIAVIRRSCSSSTPIGFSITPTITKAFAKRALEIVAHENTTRRLSEPHDLLGMHFDPAPATAIADRDLYTIHRHQVRSVAGPEEYIDLGYVPRAHTDTDIYAHFVMGDVLHLGDTFLNGMYPFIDA